MQVEQPDNLSETAVLLLRCREGDAEALNELLVRDLDWIQSYAHRHLDGAVRRQADTGDVVQEVVLRTLKYGPRFVVHDRQLFRRLMGRIIMNTIVSMARGYAAKQRSPDRERRAGSDSVLYLDGDAPVEVVTEPPVRAARAEESDWVRMAVTLLDARAQEVLRLRDWEGLSFPDIGERIGIKEDAARMCHKRGVKRLARFVQKIKAGELRALLDELESRRAG